MHNRWASVELIKPRGARPRRPNRRAKGGKKIQKNTAHSIKTRRNHAHNCPTNSSPRSSTKSVRKKWGFGVWLKGESRRQGCSYTRIQIPEERDNLTQERGPHRSQEHFQILKEIATLIAALTTRGRPGWASVVLQQCQFCRVHNMPLYTNLKQHSVQSTATLLRHVKIWTF